MSALLGRMPSDVDYRSTLVTEMGALQERITTTKQGSIVSAQAIYVPAGIDEVIEAAEKMKAGVQGHGEPLQAEHPDAGASGLRG